MLKTELLSTIEILFWENAFSDLTMDEIAKRLGMKKPSLYYHFSSKEAMFLSVVEHSYEKYRGFLETQLSIIGADVAGFDSLIASLILFPLREKNLFAVVSQKGYCQVEEVHYFIREKTEEIRSFFAESAFKNFGWNETRAFLFLTLIDSLAKRCSLERCEQKDMDMVVTEIRRIFLQK